jgi:hypothetical protein
VPTGYTADVADGNVTDFTEFALRCARNFGALITMRDSAPDAKIPSELQPNSYYPNALEKAQTRLAEVMGWDEHQADIEAQKDYKFALDVAEESKRRKDLKLQRYEAMLEQAQVWQAPTPEHAALKRFMVDQLTESIRFDCSYVIAYPTRKPGSVYKDDALKKAHKDVEYHAKKMSEEYERTRERNKWIKALRDSLATDSGAKS